MPPIFKRHVAGSKTGIVVGDGVDPPALRREDRRDRLATGETTPETEPQAAFPHQSDERPPATVARKTPRPIAARGAAGSPAEPGVRSSTAAMVDSLQRV